jgi:hypothetical protein
MKYSMQRELSDLNYSLASNRLSLSVARFAHCLRKYAETQPRVPSGNPDGGQWTGGGQDSDADEPRSILASIGFSMGKLVAEIPLLGGGRNCVYQFDFASIVVPGPTNLSCQKIVPSSAVTHGRFLNDNWKAFT